MGEVADVINQMLRDVFGAWTPWVVLMAFGVVIALVWWDRRRK